MNEDPENRGNGEGGGPLRLLWLFCAFVPAILTVSIGENWPRGRLIAGLPIGGFLLIVNAGVSIASAVGLSGIIKSSGARVLVGFLLGFVFFVINFLVYIGVGCSRSHL